MGSQRILGARKKYHFIGVQRKILKRGIGIGMLDQGGIKLGVGKQFEELIILIFYKCELHAREIPVERCQQLWNRVVANNWYYAYCEVAFVN